MVNASKLKELSAIDFRERDFVLDLGLPELVDNDVSSGSYTCSDEPNNEAGYFQSTERLHPYERGKERRIDDLGLC